MISNKLIGRVLPSGLPLIFFVDYNKTILGLPHRTSPVSSNEDIAIFNSEDCAGRQPNATCWAKSPHVECADELNVAMTSSYVWRKA